MHWKSISTIAFFFKQLRSFPMHFAVICTVYNLAFAPFQIYQVHSDCQDIFKKLLI